MKNKVSVYLISSFLMYVCFTIFLVGKLYEDKIYWDEPTYLNFVFDNLSSKIFQNSNPNFWCGPGYPIIISPIVLLFEHPKFFAVGLNILFHNLSLLLLYKSLKSLLNPIISLCFSIVFAFYFPLFSELPLMMTECFARLLLCINLFYLVKLKQEYKFSYLLISGIAFGFLCLTKIIFGYVQLLLLLLIFVDFFFKISKKTSILIKYISITYIITLPYLLFTLYVTKIPFFWANSGGENFYWMSTPFENEYGNWFPKDDFTLEKFNENQVYQNHYKEINQILSEPNYTKRDIQFKTIAKRNIFAHPIKYLKNICYNVGRLYFNFPHTNYIHSGDNVFRIFINSLFFTFTILSIVIWMVYFKSYHMFDHLIIFITYIYLLLTSLLAGLPRQLNIIIPIFIYLFALTFVKLSKLIKESNSI